MNDKNIKEFIEEMRSAASGIEVERGGYGSDTTYFWYLTGKMEAYLSIASILNTWGGQNDSG